MRYLVVILVALSALNVNAQCIIDGAYNIRCGTGSTWPVYTDDNVQAVINESNRLYPISAKDFQGNSPRIRAYKVGRINLKVPKDVPDILCLEFSDDRAIKTGIICFDTMEITER